MNDIKKKYIKTFYYKRNTEMPLIISRNIKEGIKEGDTIRFFGFLYKDNKYTKEIAKTIIDYKIIQITSSGVVIETINKYIFEDKSTLKLKGKIFSSNFNVTNNKVNAYKSEMNFLLVTKGTHKFENSIGHASYFINNGIGIIKLNIDLI